MARTLGIDLGTSGVRAVVLDGGAVRAAGAARLDPARRRDPAALRAAVAQVLSGLDLAGVEAVAVDGTSGTVLPVRADGAPAGNLSLYNDAAGPVHVAAVAASAPPASAARGATSALARAIGMQAAPGLARLLHEADWIAGQLCGRFDATDENNALKTGYDLAARAWPGWLARTGLRTALLPDVLTPGMPMGRVTQEAARRFGLPDDAVVAAGTTDGCASFLATGADRPGDAVTALGSTLTVKLLSDAPVFAPDYGIYSHRLLGHWLPGGSSNAGGAALAQFFTPGQLAALSERIDPGRPSPCDFYPLPAPGERFPINDSALPSRTTPRPPDDAAFLHGLLEGLAAVEALGYRRLAALGAPTVRRVLTVGGGAANPAWTAIRARVLGVPVLAAGSTEAAHGAALLAAHALGPRAR